MPRTVMRFHITSSGDGFCAGCPVSTPIKLTVPPMHVARSERSSVPAPPTSSTWSTPTPRRPPGPPGPADFEPGVAPPAARESARAPTPTGMLYVIDAFARPQPPRALELLAAAGSDNPPLPHGLRQREPQDQTPACT